MTAPSRGSTVAGVNLTTLAAALAGNGNVANGTKIDANPGPGLELSGGKEQVTAALRTWDAKYDSPADAAPGSAASERPFYRNVHGVTLTLVSIVLNSTITIAGNDTNTFTITIRKRDGAGGAAVLIVAYTATVAAGGVTAFVNKDLGVLSNATLADGEILTIEITKPGTGQALGHKLLCVKFTVQ